MSSPLDPRPVQADAPGGDGPASYRFSSGEPSDEERRDLARRALWTTTGTLYRWRRFIVSVTVLAAVLSVAVSLMLPKWYAATTRVLPPEGGGGGGLSSLIGELSPLASSLIGGGGGDYSRYLAILSSRSMQETVIDRFDLVRVYDVGDREDPAGEAARDLEENTEIVVDKENESLNLTVYDEDPRRAAQIANFMVEELNRRNEELALEGAARFRSYVEDRYRKIEVEMDSARAEMTAFQQRNGVIELPAMAQGLIEAAAEQQAEIAQINVQYEALLSELGPENPQVQASRRALEVARQSQADLLGGRESVMPVSMARLPAVAGEYARIYQDILVQQALMEGARPLLEQARFDEERDRVAVQVLDPAVPPVRKARPKRAVIVLVTTATAGLLACLIALAISGYRRRRADLAAAFQQAVASAR